MVCVIKFLGRGSCILRWLRRRVGERLGELRALLGKLLTRRPKSVLGELFRRLAGADRGLRVSQFLLTRQGERMRASEHAPRDPSRILERRHSLTEIIERGVGVRPTPRPLIMI